jgi:hypothetical protein
MNEISRIALIAFSVAAAAIAEESPKAHTMDMKGCSMHQEHAAGVDRRGDQAMGFSHEKTTHHFLLRKDGGIVDISANDEADTKSVTAIRGHLSHIVKMFEAGDFDVPMFIHDSVPPGMAAMKSLRGELRYRYEERPKGGRIVISSDNPKAIAAVQDFLKFQIADHRTGDPDLVTK